MSLVVVDNLGHFKVGSSILVVGLYSVLSFCSVSYNRKGVQHPSSYSNWSYGNAEQRRRVQGNIYVVR